MTDLLLHPKTADRMTVILDRPPHGLLITGETGSGKRTLARHIAAELLQTPKERLDTYPYLHSIDPSEDSIRIDAIRDLQQFLKLKVPASHQDIRRIVIIARAERMRGEAQNALLKTLEEPPADTIIILTAESPDRLLNTVVSRCRELSVLPVSQAQANSFFNDKGIPAANLAAAYALSMGQPGLLHALLNDESHPLKEQVAVAKSLLGEPAGRRLLRVETLAKDKDAARLLLNALRRIAHAGIAAAGKQGKDAALRQWRARAQATLDALESFERNANMKLLLTDLFIRL